MTVVNIPANILQSDLTASEKLLYGRIHNFAPDSCYMSVQDFCRSLNLGQLTVYKNLKHLKDLCLIKESKYGGLITVKNEE
jgi:hypothetical protein